MKNISITFLLMLSVSSAVLNAEQTGTPYCGRTDPSNYIEKDYGGGTVYEMTLLDGKMMDTNILYIRRGIIPPQHGIGEHRHVNMEEMYFVFNAPAEFTVDGHTSHLPAGSCVLCPLGSTHALYNDSETNLEWLSVGVAKEKGKGDNSIEYGPVPGRGASDNGSIRMQNTGRDVILESPTRFRWAQFDRSLTKFVGPAHLGKGKILNRRPWMDGNFETNWVRIGHCILPPQTSIGYHQHTGIEEVYYVMSGSGRSTVNDRTWVVKEGDAIPCTVNDSHGLYNHSDKDLDIFVLMVAMEQGKLDATNWGDDLSKR